MGRVEYVEIACKSAINRVQGMPFGWSLNPYVGCSHSCHYCYARAYYQIADHGSAGRDFETRILVKANLPDVLRQELARRSWKRETVAIGTSTDAYQPAEGRFRLTRQALEAFRDFRTPVGLVTKSPLVIRDADVLADLARVVKVRVFITVTTMDLELWRTIEPGTANPYKRLDALRRLVEAGVPAGVLLAPILPGITDSVESLERVADAAAEHGAMWLGSSALRLRPIVKEHYLGFVEQEFPDLLDRYARAYPVTNAPKAYQDALTARVDKIREQFGFGEESMRMRGLTPAPAPPQPLQMALPLL
ncbi:MAG: radical SAM protein [Chloroflexota bacterium]